MNLTYYKNFINIKYNNYSNLFKRNYELYIIYIKELFNVNLIKITLSIIWWQAWLALKITKFYTIIFKLIMLLPEQMIYLLNIYNRPIFNTNNKKINIISAFNEYGEITNKFRLFLKYYWESADNELYDRNGFNFSKFNELLNSSILYCSYLLTDKESNIEPNEFYNNVKNIFIQQKLKLNLQNVVLQNENELPLGRVNFDDYLDNELDEKNDNNLQDCINLINTISDNQLNINNPLNMNNTNEDLNCDRYDKLVKKIVLNYEKKSNVKKSQM